MMSATSDIGFADRLVFLHGFTQTHHHWHRCAHQIAERMGTRPALAFVDLPGHGLSSHDRTDIDAGGAQLADLVGRGTYVGYSMGGRFGLSAAAARPSIIERLVLIGATPGIEALAERADRRRLDDERAQRIETIGVEAFLDEWLAAPLFASLPPDDQGLAHRRRNTASGLAHSLRTCGTGNQSSLWGHLGKMSVPVLAIAGDRDTKFTDIARRMVEALPNANFASIEDAGHATHSEQPEATAAVITEWLAATTTAPAVG